MIFDINLAQAAADVVIRSLILAGVALGFGWLLRGTGVFNLAYGALFVASGYIFRGFLGIGLEAYMAIFANAVALGLVMLILDLGFRATESPRQSAYIESGLSALIASLGLALIVEYACAWLFGSDVMVVSPRAVVRGYQVPAQAVLAAVTFFGFLIMRSLGDRRRRVIASVGWGLLTITCFLITRGEAPVVYVPRGRLLTACAATALLLVAVLASRSRAGSLHKSYLLDRSTAAMLGYPIEHHRAVAVVGSGLAVGALSAIYCLDVGIRPDESFSLLTSAAFVAVTAGVGIYHTVLSSILFVSIPYLSTFLVASHWRDVLGTSMLLVALSLRAQWSIGFPWQR